MDNLGKPPKSADEIRAKLGAIHSGGLAGEQGPAKNGLDADARFVIGSFHDHAIGMEFQKKLSQAGVGSWAERRSRKLNVLIEYEDRETAAAILDEHRRVRPDRMRKSLRREFDYLIFGGVIGATMGSIFVVNVLTEPIVLSAPIAFGLFGAILGHLADRVRIQLRDAGRFRFGIRDFLIVPTLPALGVYIWRLVGQLI